MVVQPQLVVAVAVVSSLLLSQLLASASPADDCAPYEQPHHLEQLVAVEEERVVVEPQLVVAALWLQLWHPLVVALQVDDCAPCELQRRVESLVAVVRAVLVMVPPHELVA